MVCGQYVTDYKGGVFPTVIEEWRLVDERAMGGESELLALVNRHREENDLPKLYWNQALFRTVYHTARMASLQPDKTPPPYDREFSGIGKQAEYFGFYNRAEMWSNGGNLGVKLSPQAMFNRKVFRPLWNSLTVYSDKPEIGIACVSGFWYLMVGTKNENESDDCKQEPPMMGSENFPSLQTTDEPEETSTAENILPDPLDSSDDEDMGPGGDEAGTAGPGAGVTNCTFAVENGKRRKCCTAVDGNVECVDMEEEAGQTQTDMEEDEEGQTQTVQPPPGGTATEEEQLQHQLRNQFSIFELASCQDGDGITVYYPADGPTEGYDDDAGPCYGGGCC
jgi:hypothetical protein